jgi:hypothetical protein
MPLSRYGTMVHRWAMPQADPGPPSERSVRLVAEVAGVGAPTGLAAELLSWVDESTGMRRFVEANATKIRRKLREARDAETRRDLRAELLAAALLLADRRIELAYEASGAGRAGPDFAVSFRGVTRCNVEVTRRRGAADAAVIGDVVLAKLRQLPPSVPNVLVVAVERAPRDDELTAALLALRAHVDARDAATLARAGAADPRAFYDRFLRLAAVIAWAETAPAGTRAVAWVNPSARIQLDPGAFNTIREALAA